MSPVDALSAAAPEPRVNILLVDDEERNLDVLESLLHAPELNLVRANTAERALMELLEGEFAVLVLDIQMPGMNGLELAHLIKQRKRTQHIPIIFLTAYFQEDRDILEGYETGAVDYLTKPVNPQILRSKIAVFVDLFRKTRALAMSNQALEQEIAQRQQAQEALHRANSELETRVQARTADLRFREAQLRLVTDYAPVLVVHCDRQHRFKFANRTFASWFGRQPEELIGAHLAEILGASYATFGPHCDAALDGRRVEFEAELIGAAAGSRWFYVIHEPERAGEGEVVGFVAVITDITERREAEQEIMAARDRALAAARAKDEFLARLSHELRTPLSPVLLLASEAAQNGDLPARVRADFEMIAANVALEARLIDDLLDLTRITRGKLALEQRPIDVHTMLQEACALVQPDAAQKGITLNLVLAAERRLVNGDDVRLKQIFWNVVQNAVKFTPDGGRVLIESLAPRDQSAITIRVSDNGVGMKADELERVFEAFIQGDHAGASGSQRFGGLGLGLAIARMLVELHGGSIHAASPGLQQGTVFTIELPLLPPGLVPAKSPEPVEPRASGRATTSERRGSGCRILLVEDHQPTRSTLTALLTRRRCEVVSAATATEARTLAAQESFSLLISDIGLPDGTGHELMREFRERYGLAGIALTGYGTSDDVTRSHSAGFVTHLTKPVTIQALDEALATALPERKPVAARRG